MAIGITENRKNLVISKPVYGLVWKRAVDQRVTTVEDQIETFRVEASGYRLKRHEISMNIGNE